MGFIRKNAKGTLLCLGIAVPAWALVGVFRGLEVIGAPVLSILSGMAFAYVIKGKEGFREGIAFTSKKILQYAVVLLGFGLNLSTVGKVGAQSLPVILSTVGTSLVTAYLVYRLLKIPSRTATLIGVGSCICGGSAIAATAPVIGADDGEIAQSVSVIFLFNVAAAILFPAFGGFLGLGNEGFGLFAGTAVNDTSSVTAAASTWDTLHGTGGAVLAYATVVKLTRTLAIIPVTLVLAFIRMRREKGAEGVSLRSVFPMFILYFVLASLATTVSQAVFTGPALAASQTLFSLLQKLSKFFIVMAMAAIGLNTDIGRLIRRGGRPILLGFCCWAAIVAASLGVQRALGLW